MKFLSALCAVVASTVINWGLSPTTDETTPRCPDGAQTLLEQYNGFYVGNTDEKKVFLTFDLGYEAGYTSLVLDILKENNIKGIFFLCGNYLQEIDLVERMIAEGHVIGNHTDRHKDLPTLSEEAIKADIMTFQNDFTTQFAHAEAPVFFRPPQGRIDEKTLRIACDNGFKTTMWSIAIVDWGKTAIDAVACADKIASRIHPGAVVLLHIANSGTPEMLKLLVPQLIEKGYHFGNPSELA